MSDENTRLLAQDLFDQINTDCNDYSTNPAEVAHMKVGSLQAELEIILEKFPEVCAYIEDYLKFRNDLGRRSTLTRLAWPAQWSKDYDNLMRIWNDPENRGQKD